MPIYRYECESCGWSEEFLEGLDASSVRGCDACGAQARRMMPMEVALLMGTSGRRIDKADLMQKEYMERPEFVARVKKGEIEVKTPKRGVPSEAKPYWMK